MNESDVSRKLRVELEARGAWFYKASDRFHASIPDLIGCFHGRFIGIEVKMHPNKPTDLQRHTLFELLEHEAATFLIQYKKADKTYRCVDLRGQETTLPSHKEAVSWLLGQLSLNIRPRL